MCEKIFTTHPDAILGRKCEGKNGKNGKIKVVREEGGGRVWECLVWKIPRKIFIGNYIIIILLISLYFRNP